MHLNVKEVELNIRENEKMQDIFFKYLCKDMKYTINLIMCTI